MRNTGKIDMQNWFNDNLDSWAETHPETDWENYLPITEEDWDSLLNSDQEFVAV